MHLPGRTEANRNTTNIKTADAPSNSKQGPHGYEASVTAIPICLCFSLPVSAVTVTAKCHDNRLKTDAEPIAETPNSLTIFYDS
jgi:hypothetical protein